MPGSGVAFGLGCMYVSADRRALQGAPCAEAAASVRRATQPDAPRLRRRQNIWQLLAILTACQAESGFEREALPILEQSCLAARCHGALPGAEAAGEVLNDRGFFVRVDGNGFALDPDAARRAALAHANTAEDPRFSTLLRKALPGHEGGLPHGGGALFFGGDDPRAQALLRWLEGEPQSAGAEGRLELTPLQEQFRAEVEPLLLAAGCALGNCHGLQSPVPLRLDAGAAARMPRASSAANAAAARTMLALHGDGASSRLLRKTLRLGKGGLPHRAGAVSAATPLEAELRQALVDWACAERLAVSGVACDPPGPTALSALALTVAVPAAEPLFALDVYAAGTSVWLAKPGTAGPAWALERDLGASVCAGCDVRDPAASDDGASVLVAGRLIPSASRLLYRLPVAGGAAEALTALPPGRVVHDRDPCVGPGGRIYFVSDRAGALADDGGLGSEVFEWQGPGLPPRRRTFSPHRARFTTAFGVGSETAGTVAMTLLRAVHGVGQKAHPFRFAPDLHNEVHQHFGVTLPFAGQVATRETASGDYVAIGLPLDSTEVLGSLLLVDRNLGPALAAAPAASTPSLPAYLPPMQEVDLSAYGVLRAGDPAPLPDDGLLLIGADAAGQTRLMRLQLGHQADGAVVADALQTLLLAPPGRTLRQPVPLLRRAPLPPPGPERGDPKASVGVLVHQGLPMIDALLGHLQPSGPRPVRDDFVAMRLLAPVELSAAARAPLPSKEAAAAGLAAFPWASRATLAGVAPTRALAELPLAGDGSVFTEVPAEAPFRVQGLDAEGIAAGAAHNRWLHAERGQKIPQGVHARDDGPYAAMCATCHGANDGDATQALPLRPDLMTSASWSLARFQGANPRRPLPPRKFDPSGALEVDFKRDVRPVLIARCVGCHGDTPAAGLDLRPIATPFFDRAYEQLLQRGEGSAHGYRYVDGAKGRARSSYLIELLLGRELDAPRALPAVAAPHGDLSAAERRVLLRWIDLGAAYLGSAEAAGGSGSGGTP